MAELAIRLPIFVASPGDVKVERETAREEILSLGEKITSQRIILEPFLWEHHARPSYRRPQAFINKHLRTSELTVAIFWNRLGSAASLDGTETGAEEEFRIAGEQIYKGQSDDVFLYFREPDPPPGASPDQIEKVREFRERIGDSKSVLYWTYLDPEEFRFTFRRHLEQWVRRWDGIAEISQYALENSPSKEVPSDYFGENRLQAILRVFDFKRYPQLTDALGNIAVDRYQVGGQQAAFEVFEPRALGSPKKEWKPLVADTSDGSALAQLAQLAGRTFLSPQPLVARGENQLAFADLEWFFFFCGWGLTRRVAAGDLTAVESLPYLNEIHQYFSVFAAEHRGVIVQRLIDWLSNKENVTRLKPIARNFAAYELGMLEALEAQDVLAEAAEKDRGEGVKLYSVMALGKMRSRRYLQLLAELFKSSTDRDERLSISQAICRITGITDFEL